MSTTLGYANMRKECLITTGATAQFESLIKSALSPESLAAFKEYGFTHLNFQCGDSFPSFQELKPIDTQGLRINAFDFSRYGLNKEMRACQEKKGSSEKGLVICHAGAGTILDAMRLGLSLVVVPNESLLDNHQEELAEELEAQGYATKSSTKNLADGIRTACKKDAKLWGGHSGNFAKIIDNVVGYEDDVQAQLD